MAQRLVHKSVHIQASAQTIWRIITENAFNIEWLAAFGEGNRAETDWQEGSKARFFHGPDTGLIATISESRPYEKVRIQNIGLITRGMEDCNSEEALASRGFYEQYLLIPEGNAIRMHVEVVVEESFYEEVSGSWEKALATIKQQAEALRYNS